MQIGFQLLGAGKNICRCGSVFLIATVAILVAGIPLRRLVSFNGESGIHKTPDNIFHLDVLHLCAFRDGHNTPDGSQHSFLRYFRESESPHLFYHFGELLRQLIDALVQVNYLCHNSYVFLFTGAKVRYI